MWNFNVAEACRSKTNVSWSDFNNKYDNWAGLICRSYHLPVLPPTVTAKQRVVIPGDQPEEGINGKKESFKTRVENATRKTNKRSRITAWQWRRTGWLVDRTYKEHEE